MNRDGDKSAKTALRSQKQPKAQQQLSVQKKKKRDAQSVSDSKDSQSGQCDSGREMKSAAVQGKRPGKVASSAPMEGQRSPGAQRKLSDASNASEDLSKDSGCPSGKVSTSDSSSEISDCASEGNKRDSPSCDNELIWTNGRAYVSPGSEGKGDGKPCVKAARDTCDLQPDAAGGGLSLLNSSGSFIDLMMGETTEDLVREVEDLRSENEYLKVSLIHLSLILFIYFLNSVCMSDFRLNFHIFAGMFCKKSLGFEHQSRFSVKAHVSLH